LQRYEQINATNLNEIGSLARNAVYGVQLQQLSEDGCHTGITGGCNEVAECHQNIHFTVALDMQRSIYNSSLRHNKAKQL